MFKIYYFSPNLQQLGSRIAQIAQPKFKRPVWAFFFVGGNVFAMVEIMNFWQSLWPVVKICVFFCRFSYNTSYVVI